MSSFHHPLQENEGKDSFALGLELRVPVQSGLQYAIPLQVDLKHSESI